MEDNRINYLKEESESTIFEQILFPTGNNLAVKSRDMNETFDGEMIYERFVRK